MSLGAPIAWNPSTSALAAWGQSQMPAPAAPPAPAPPSLPAAYPNPWATASSPNPWAAPAQAPRPLQAYSGSRIDASPAGADVVANLKALGGNLMVSLKQVWAQLLQAIR